MANQTVYIPPALKQRMEAVAWRLPNWSRVAQKAFADECARLAKMKRPRK